MPLFWLGDQLTTWDAFDGIQTAVLGMHYSITVSRDAIPVSKTSI